MLRGLVALLAAAVALAVLVPAAGRPAPVCTRVAGPGGAQRLADSLAPGEIGCLLPGDHAGGLTVTRGGEPGRPIVLRSATEEPALVRGRVWVTRTAHDVVLEQLRLDSHGEVASPVVNGRRVTFRGDDVTSRHASAQAPKTGICFVLGDANGVYGVASDVVLDGNRIHDCGPLPANNHGHGVYVEAARRTTIVNNVIYDNSDRGIQLYPDAQGTVIAHNVIDGNGEGVLFSGSAAVASSGTEMIDNVVSNSRIRSNVESYYAGELVGRDNVVARNCLWHGAEGDVGAHAGFETSGDVVADPLYVDRAAKDFRLRPGSPCADKGPAP